MSWPAHWCIQGLKELWTNFESYLISVCVSTKLLVADGEKIVRMRVTSYFTLQCSGVTLLLTVSDLCYLIRQHIHNETTWFAAEFSESWDDTVASQKVCQTAVNRCITAAWFWFVAQRIMSPECPTTRTLFIRGWWTTVKEWYPMRSRTAKFPCLKSMATTGRALWKISIM